MSDETPGTFAEQGVEDLQDLYENAPCGYLSLDSRGRIVKVNATMANWLGLDRESIRGKRLLDLLNITGAMFYETHFAPLLRMQGFFHEVALDFRKADGSVLATLANAAERRNDAGELMFTRVTIFPATDRRRYERELVESQHASERARRELERGLLAERATAELREQFVAVLGHDLRNPLAAIDAGARILLRGSRLDEKQTETTRLIRSAVSRMSRLIDDVLDLADSRLGGGITIRRDENGDVEATVAQVVAELRAAHEHRKIDVETRMLHKAAVDHARFAQLVSNLVGNALSHGAEDGTVTVRLTVADGVLTLRVANAGEPIPPSIVPHLFRPFYRGSGRSGLKGLGLGLFIAYEIAHAHGGRIEVQSDETETIFTVTMPSTAPQADQP